MEKVTRQDLIAEFRRLTDELGENPTLGEFEDGKYSSTPVYKRFENYGELKEAAGYESGEKRIDDETLLTDLRRVADDLGRSPPVMKYDKHGNHNSKTLKRRFGNWSEVLSEAGLEDTGHAKHWRDNEPDQFDNDYGSVEVECAYCGDTKTTNQYTADHRERFFCDYDCRGSFLSTQTGEEARAYNGGKVELVCEVCGEIDMRKPSEVDSSRFCSQDCMLEWRSQELVGENHPRYKEENVETYYGPNFPEQRLKALERDDHRCQVCGKSNEQNIRETTSGLNCHHIRKFRECDGYRKANHLRNLVMLCSECHQYVENNQITVPSAGWHRQEAVKVAVSDAPMQKNLTLYIA